MSDGKDNVDNDFEFVRQTQYDLLVKGSSALEDMMDVARATEHPRAYEVLSNMMKNVADISNNLLDLHKKKKEYHKEEGNALPLTMCLLGQQVICSVCC
jgi:hypothetical protein